MTTPTPLPPKPILPAAPPSTLTAGKITAWIGIAIAIIGFLNTAPVFTLIPQPYAAIIAALGFAIAKYGALLHTDQSTNGTA